MRTLKNYLIRIKKITLIFINSPSAGLAIWDQFFDLEIFIDEKVISVTSWIDKTGTLNPRGKIFKDRRIWNH